MPSAVGTRQTCSSGADGATWHWNASLSLQDAQSEHNRPNESLMSALNLCITSKVWPHVTKSKYSPIINVQSVLKRSVGCFSMFYLFEEIMCTGDQRVFQYLSVKHQPKDPSASNFHPCITAVHMAHSYSIPAPSFFLCVAPVTWEAAVSNLSILRTQESVNGLAKRDTVVNHPTP